MTQDLLVNIPVGAAIIAVVSMFLRHISSERAKDRVLWSNHLSKVTETLEELVVAVKLLEARLKERP